MAEARIFNYERHFAWTAGVRFPAEARDISLFHNVYTDSGTYPASSPMDARSVS
jgi:hypothetical protein